MVKHSPAMRETRVRSLGREDPLEKEMATHSSILACKIPQTEETGRLQSMGLQRVGHDWAISLATKPPPIFIGQPWGFNGLLTGMDTDLMALILSGRLQELNKQINRKIKIQIVISIVVDQIGFQFSQFSCSVVSYSLRPHESQHARPPCSSPTPGVHSNSCPLSWWCHPVISSSVVPFSSCPQSLPASGSFPMSQLFAWGGQNIGVSALSSFLLKNTQDWSPLEWTGWISLQSKGLSRIVFK